MTTPTTDVRRAVRDIVDRATGAWRAPEGFLILAADDLTELGTDAQGFAWYRHAKGELRRRPRVLDEVRDVLPDRPLLRVSDSEFAVHDWYEPGSFARAGIPIAPRLARRRPARRFNGLLGVYRWFGDFVGPDQLLQRLEHHGYTVTAHPTEVAIDVTRAGRDDGRIADLLGRPGVIRWLWRHLRGLETACESVACGHQRPVPSAGVGVGGLFLCIDALDWEAER